MLARVQQVADVMKDSKQQIAQVNKCAAKTKCQVYVRNMADSALLGSAINSTGLQCCITSGHTYNISFIRLCAVNAGLYCEHVVRQYVSLSHLEMKIYLETGITSRQFMRHSECSSLSICEFSCLAAFMSWRCSTALHASIVPSFP